jgi:hypothetical protein
VKATKHLRWALLFLLLPALAIAGYSRRLSDAQALTETAPTGSTVTAGVHFPLADLVGYRITICADSGQTLTNVTLDTHYIDTAGANLWTKNTGQTLTATAVGTRCATFDDQPVSAQMNGSYLMVASNGTTVSGGTVTIYYQGRTE